MTSAVDGFEAGDLAVILDKDLARTLSDFMHRSKDCQAGSDFDKQHPMSTPARKRAGGGTYGQALCASEAVISMGGVEAGASWNDLLCLNPAGVWFEWAAGPALDAAKQFADFVRAYAPLVELPGELTEQLANYIFALAVDTIVDNIFPLGESNPIKATMITTGANPSGTSGKWCPGKDSVSQRLLKCHQTDCTNKTNPCFSLSLSVVSRMMRIVP